MECNELSLGYFFFECRWPLKRCLECQLLVVVVFNACEVIFFSIVFNGFFFLSF